MLFGNKETVRFYVAKVLLTYLQPMVDLQKKLVSLLVMSPFHRRFPHIVSAQIKKA